MAKAAEKRVTCRECGKRRVKAIVENPVTGKKRKVPIKVCQECYPKAIDYKFFNSSFGVWLRYAFKRQCTESIPKDTQELGALIILWRACKKACGFSSDGEGLTKAYEYELCHIDPAKGEDGLVGRLVAHNLVIAPALLNRKLSNLPFPATSKLSVLGGESIDDDNFKQICRERYDLHKLTVEFLLEPNRKKKALSVFETDGVPPSRVLSMELNRLGYTTDLIFTDDEDERSDLVTSVFETFFKVGGTLAVAQMKGYKEHTRKAMSWEVEYDMTLPYERTKDNQQKRKEREAQRECEF